MTKASVLLATAFCAVLAMECSSSSNNGPSKDAAPPVFADSSGNPLASPSPGICGTDCVAPKVCCVGFLSMTGQCQDPSAMCSGTIASCMSPTDCMGSQVCCGSANMGGGGFTLKCADTCTAGGGGFAFQLCDSTHACPTGTMCTAPPGAPGGRGGGDGGTAMICFNPNMFRMMDAGASEAGSPETGASDTGSSADTASPTDAGGG